jgi:hypothetical protein
MTAARNLYLAVGFTAITNAWLELSLWHLEWRYIIHIHTISTLNIVSKYTIKNKAIVQIFDVMCDKF